MSTQINLSKHLYPVLSMGPGRRLDIVLQGCSIAMGGNPCYKCFSKDLWDGAGGNLVKLDDAVAEAASIVAENELDGVTITGGEPTDQAEQLTALLRGVKQGLEHRGYQKEVDWLLFSWHYEKQFRLQFGELYEELDALVLGPYRYEESVERPLVATGNQQLVLRTALAKERYADLSAMPRLDFAVSAIDETILVIGVSHKDEMDDICAKLQERSISLQQASWD